MSNARILYLVGDIVDFWKVRRGPHWPQSHNDVLQKLLRKARKGTRVVFIPGNHDDGLRDYAGMNFGGVELRRDALHEGANGKRYLILHGDEFDVVVRYARWLAFLGDRSYDAALALNVPLNFARRLLGLGHWSLSAFLKLKVKSAVNYIGEFEDALASEARRRGASGLICGHIHHANERDDRRHPLPQLRRLGRKLHGHRRALRRYVRNHPLERPAGGARHASAFRPLVHRSRLTPLEPDAKRCRLTENPK